MALRRRFFADTERRTMIDASALETDWHARVESLPAPYCFVSEAVIIYLENAQVDSILRGLAARFPGAWLLTDTTSSKLADGQAKHDAMSKLPKDAWFRWRCDDPKRLERLGLRLERSHSFADAPADVVARMPLPYRILLAIAPWIMRRQVDGYRINRFQLVAPLGSVLRWQH